jgi:hypothetical protein
MGESARSVLVHRDAECISADFWLGNFASGQSGLEQCETACAAQSACRYFVFGHGNKAGACYHEVTADAKCREGFEADDYDFYELVQWQPLDGIRSGEAITRLHGGAECLSADAELGFFPGRIDECAAACARAPSCVYFIFGHGAKDGRCYHEFTSSSRCVEGFERDAFDFYELRRPDTTHAQGSGAGHTGFWEGLVWGSGLIGTLLLGVGLLIWRRRHGQFPWQGASGHERRLVPVQALL